MSNRTRQLTPRHVSGVYTSALDIGGRAVPISEDEDETDDEPDDVSDEIGPELGGLTS